MPATLGSMTAPANTRSTRGVSAAASASRLGLRRLAEGEPAAEDLGRAEAYGVSGDEADPPEHEDYEGEGAPDAPSDGEHTLVQRAAASSVGSIAHETRDLEHEPCTGTGRPVPVPACALWRADAGVGDRVRVRGLPLRPDSTLAWGGAGGLKPLPRPRGPPVRRVRAAPA